MRVIVGVKRVVDYAVAIRIQADKKGACNMGPVAGILGLGSSQALPGSNPVDLARSGRMAGHGMVSLLFR